MSVSCVGGHVHCKFRIFFPSWRKTRKESRLCVLGVRAVRWTCNSWLAARGPPVSFIAARPSTGPCRIICSPVRFVLFRLGLRFFFFVGVCFVSAGRDVRITAGILVQSRFFSSNFQSTCFELIRYGFRFSSSATKRKTKRNKNNLLVYLIVIENIWIIKKKWRNYRLIRFCYLVKRLVAHCSYCCKWSLEWN